MVVAKKWRVRMNPIDVSKKEIRFGTNLMYQRLRNKRIPESIQSEYLGEL